MAMKENVRSLKAYFIIASIFVGLLNLKLIFEGVNLIEKGSGFIGLFLAFSWFVIGIKLKYFLLNKIIFIHIVLGIDAILLGFGIGAILLGLSFLVILTQGIDPKIIGQVIKDPKIIGQVILGPLILIYLYKNVNRLALEEKNKLENPDSTIEEGSPKIIGKFTEVLLTIVFLLLLIVIGVPSIVQLLG